MKKELDLFTLVKVKRIYTRKLSVFYTIIRSKKEWKVKTHQVFEFANLLEFKFLYQNPVSTGIEKEAYIKGIHKFIPLSYIE